MKASRFWQYINRGSLSMESLKKNMPMFKSTRVNFGISLHNPDDEGERYLRTLIYVLTTALTEQMFEKLKKINGRSKGYPIAILYQGESVCLDYLQALFEMNFLDKYIDLNGLDILEIGAGYGRTCHAIMSNYNVKSYTIADLENCLAFSHRYLKEVLPKEEFEKIKFVLVEHESLSSDFDLCLSIDAFSEMDEGQAEQYVKYVEAHCRYFYIKTQLCQYEVNVSDVPNHRIIKLTINRLFDKINQFDDQSVKAQIPKFLVAYKPGLNWTCLGDSNALPYMQYWQAMYKKNGAAV